MPISVAVITDCGQISCALRIRPGEDAQVVLTIGDDRDDTKRTATMDAATFKELVRGEVVMVRELDAASPTE